MTDKNAGVSKNLTLRHFCLDTQDVLAVEAAVQERNYMVRNSKVMLASMPKFSEKGAKLWKMTFFP